METSKNDWERGSFICEFCGWEGADVMVEQKIGLLLCPDCGYAIMTIKHEDTQIVLRNEQAKRWRVKTCGDVG